MKFLFLERASFSNYNIFLVFTQLFFISKFIHSLLSFLCKCHKSKFYPKSLQGSFFYNQSSTSDTLRNLCNNLKLTCYNSAFICFTQGYVKGEEFCWSYCDFFLWISLSNQITHTDIVNPTIFCSYQICRESLLQLSPTETQYIASKTLHILLHSRFGFHIDTLIPLQIDHRHPKTFSLKILNKLANYGYK